MKLAIMAVLCLFNCVTETTLHNSEIAFIVKDKELIPEGITYSSTTGSFYLGSINKTKIIRIDPDTGENTDFVSPDILGMLVLGMTVDEKRGFLWACAEGLKGPPYKSAIAKFELCSGKLLKTYDHVDSLQYTFNDITLDSEGNAYFTDRANHSILKIVSAVDSIDLIYKSNEIEYPNGITISPDDKYLYIASATKGIRVIRLNDKRIVGSVNKEINSGGIDGLKYYKGSLIGIQNWVEDSKDIKIARYFLDEAKANITEMEIIDQDNPYFNTPTTFVIVDDHLYCIANSQVGNFSNEGIKDPSILEDIIILKYKL